MIALNTDLDGIAKGRDTDDFDGDTLNDPHFQQTLVNGPVPMERDDGPGLAGLELTQDSHGPPISAQRQSVCRRHTFTRD